MDLTFLLSGIIFTLLAIVLATSLFCSSPGFVNAMGYLRYTRDAKAGGLGKSAPEQNAMDDSGSSHDHWDVAKSVQPTEDAAESTGIDDDMLESNASDSLNYVPGKSRTNHLQKMMSKDELEEEQRVQREQLAAIFQLLKENKETFGDVSEGDMEEQLKLYSI